MLLFVNYWVIVVVVVVGVVVGVVASSEIKI